MELITANRANAILYWFLTEKSLPGDTFILPTNICPEVVLTFLKADKKIRFLDIEPLHFCINLQEAYSILNEQPIKGILYNHTYGTCYTPFEKFIELKITFPQILLIDDKCLCAPEETITESASDLVIFSTNHKKQVDLGYGGYGWVKEKLHNSSNLESSEDSVEEVRNLIRSSQTSFKRWEQASKLKWLKAKQLNIKTIEYFHLINDYSKKWEDHKAKLVDTYKKNLLKEVILDDEFQNWRFQIRLKNKNKILKTIFSKGLFASDLYKSLGTRFEKKTFPIAETLENEIVNLFIDKYFSTEQARKLCEILNKYTE